MKKLYLVFPVLLMLFTFTNDKIEGRSDNLMVKTEIDESVIPFDRVIFSVMGDEHMYKTEQLTAFYKIDMNTAAPEYIDNLKNMWFCLLCSKIAKEGSIEEKKFFLNEQINLYSNLPNYNRFYYLLRNCSSFISDDEMKSIATAFYDKNNKILNGTNWEDENTEKQYKEDLIMSIRNHGLLTSHYNQ
ncbi:hypothetical protein [Flavobacterium beibuense]|nr:hypothetical protein [Flavobacterium beibuense]